MAEVVKKPLKITETVLRDAHQSLIATRMTTEQMLPIVDKMDKVGYNAVECWGGATFDASLRFLKEDPWERLRKLRDGFKNTKLQMLFRVHKTGEHGFLGHACQPDAHCLFNLMLIVVDKDNGVLLIVEAGIGKIIVVPVKTFDGTGA